MVLSDIYATVNALDEMPTKETYWDVNETNGSMGFGGEATGTGSEPEYDFYGKIHAREGMDGYMTYTQAESDTGMRWIDGKAIYCRVFTGTSLISAGSTTVGAIADMDALVAVQGYALATQGTRVPVNFAYYANTQQMFTVNVWSDGTVHAFKGNAWEAAEYQIAILYTKSTSG